MAGYQMELQEYSEEYMYKDGMLSNDIYSFDNASGNVIAGEARSHWATMGFYTRLNWNYNNIYFLEFSGRYDGSPVLLQATVGDSSRHSLPVMILHALLISSNWHFLCLS